MTKQLLSWTFTLKKGRSTFMPNLCTNVSSGFVLNNPNLEGTQCPVRGKRLTRCGVPTPRTPLRDEPGRTSGEQRGGSQSQARKAARCAVWPSVPRLQRHRYRRGEPTFRGRDVRRGWVWPRRDGVRGRQGDGMVCLRRPDVGVSIGLLCCSFARRQLWGRRAGDPERLCITSHSRVSVDNNRVEMFNETTGDRG